MKKIVLSGIQPTGMLHIGNYLGAIRNWVASQDAFENFFCLVDLHAVTVPHDPATLRAKVRELAGVLLAAGISPEKSALFVQSQVPAHAELAWVFNCVAHMGQLRRMTQFKEKSDGDRDNVSVGLFTYPLLMAADILLYQADRVPVGSDQKQHVELTRDIAQRFNATFGDTFKLPEPVIPEVGARVMGLDDGTRKMSKSVQQAGHAVGVLDSPEVIRKKFRSAKTDSIPDIRFDEARPEITNLLTIYQAFTGTTRDQCEAHFAGKGFAALKGDLADAVIAGLAPLQERYRDIAADPATLDAVLQRGADRVLPIADRTMALVNERMGLMGRRSRPV